MTNENKKAWISLIVPILYVILLLFTPERLNTLLFFIAVFPFFLILQFYLTKLLDRKFPTSRDLKD